MQLGMVSSAAASFWLIRIDHERKAHPEISHKYYRPQCIVRSASESEIFLLYKDGNVMVYFIIDTIHTLVRVLKLLIVLLGSSYKINLQDWCFFNTNPSSWWWVSYKINLHGYCFLTKSSSIVGIVLHSRPVLLQILFSVCFRSESHWILNRESQSW